MPATPVLATLLVPRTSSAWTLAAGSVHMSWSGKTGGVEHAHDRERHTHLVRYRRRGAGAGRVHHARAADARAAAWRPGLRPFLFQAGALGADRHRADPLCRPPW